MTAPAYLFAEPTARPLDINGDIMPGAYLRFYLTGTTTLTNIYADADLTTPLANPLTANADGRFVPIYLDPITTYRVQLFDALDVLQYDVDPYLPPRDFQPGTVLMFFGTQVELEAAYPPAEWQICNGSNGSPDMRDRMPIGVSATLAPGDTGGAAGTVFTSSNGAHTHTGSAGNTALTESQGAVHAHNVWANTLATSAGAHGLASTTARTVAGYPGTGGTEAYVASIGGGGANQVLQNSGGGATHTHTISSDGAHTHTVSAIPPFVALWFIMRRP